MCVLGTWLKKEDQALFDSAEKVFTASDNDQAGREAGRRLVDLWLGRAVSLALLAAVKDLGELAEWLDGQAVIERAVDETGANGRSRAVGIEWCCRDTHQAP